MQQKMPPRGARWNLPDWNSDPEEREALHAQISELEAERGQLSQNIGALNGELARYRDLDLRACADRLRAQQADAIAEERDAALAAAASLHAVAHHLGETGRSGILSRLMTILRRRVAVPDARIAYRVSWRAPRSTQDIMISPRAARRIKDAAAIVAACHQQRGRTGYIFISVAHGDAPYDLHTEIADCAQAHCAASLMAEAVPLDRVGRAHGRYSGKRASVTIALHDVEPLGWRPLIDPKSGRFAASRMAEPISRLLPLPNRTGIGTAASLRNQPLRFASVAQGRYDVAVSRDAYEGLRF